MLYLEVHEQFGLDIGTACIVVRDIDYRRRPNIGAEVIVVLKSPTCPTDDAVEIFETMFKLNTKKAVDAFIESKRLRFAASAMASWKDWRKEAFCLTKLHWNAKERSK